MNISKLTSSILLFLTVFLTTTQLSAATISAEDFFKNPEFSNLQLSPDGDKLAAIAPVGNRRNLVVMDIKTREARAVTSLKKTDIAYQGYVWATNDRLLFYIDDDGNESLSVFGVNADGTKPRELASNSSTISIMPRYTRVIHRLKDNPQEVLVISNKRRLYAADVYRMNVFNGRTKRVTTNDGTIQGWVPDQDGRILAAVSVDDDLHTKILYRPTEDAEWETLAEGDWGDHGWIPLGFSHSGKILYVSSNLDRDTMALHEYDLEERQMGSQLFAHDQVDINGIFISDTKKKLIMVGYETDKPKTKFFYKEFEALFTEINSALPDTINNLASMSEDESKMIIRAYSDKVRGDYYLFDRNKKSLEKLLSVSNWINAADMATVKPIKYETRDGETINGYLTLPNGVEAKNLPLIIHPHGGPYGVRDSWRYNTSIQFLANRGYAVLQMNFRGSGGYGKRFEDIGHQKWGLEMQDDITDGVLWAIKEGIADKDRICIYGASYGGYAAMAGVTFTPDLYKCAINVVGVVNLDLLHTWDTKDANRGGGWLASWFHQAIGNPKIPEDAKRFKATSPIEHIDKIKVPVLVIHGVRDPRVEIKQARDLIKQLKKHGVTYEKLIKRKEGHGFAKEENRIEQGKIMEAFLEKYL